MHNAKLPQQRYVSVYAREITGRDTERGVWLGISSTPGRALGCHVLLESGAMLSDLPLHWLGTAPHSAPLEDCQAWDCFGYNVVLCELPLFEATVLDAAHRKTNLLGEYWFSLDWIENGWSNHPEQHKLMHLLACEDGSLRLLPTDRLLWRDASFTVDGDVPRIQRQVKVWSVE